MSKAKLRKQLDEAMSLIGERLRLAQDYDDRDAVSLENLAHQLQGIYFDCENAEDIAGDLALAIATPECWPSQLAYETEGWTELKDGADLENLVS